MDNYFAIVAGSCVGIIPVQYTPELQAFIKEQKVIVGCPAIWFVAPDGEVDFWPAPSGHVIIAKEVKV